MSCLTSVCTALCPVPEQYQGSFPSPIFTLRLLADGEERQANAKPSVGNRRWFQKTGRVLFSLGTRAAGREDAQETGAGRGHLARAEPSFEQKLCAPGCWGPACMASQVGGLHLSKPRQSLTALTEGNVQSPQAGAVLRNWVAETRKGLKPSSSPISLIILVTRAHMNPPHWSRCV